MRTSLQDLTVGDLLDAVASDAPAPGGGAVAALVVAQAAGLAAMAGRFSVGRELPSGLGAEAFVAAADRLRAVAAPLADADADAYEGFLAAIRLPREPDPAARSAAVAAALSRAAEVPLATAEAAAEVADVAERLAGEGNPNLRGDAAAAALLAAAAATTAAIMVAENLAKIPDDPRVARAVTAAGSARAAADRVSAMFPAMAAVAR